MKNATRSVNRGADGYIVKSVKIEELVSTIEEHPTRQRKAQKEMEKKFLEFIQARNREKNGQLKFYAPSRK